MVNYVLSCAPIMSPVVFHLKNMDKEVTVVTSSEDVKRCCIAMNIKFIYFERTIPSFKSTKKPIAFVREVKNYILGLISLKTGLDAVVARIDLRQEDSFHLLTRMIAYDNFYLAKEFAKKGMGKVYFSGINWLGLRLYSAKSNRVFFKLLFLKFLLRTLLGIDIMYYDEGNAVPLLGINDKFLTKNKILDNVPREDFVQFMLQVVTKNKSDQKRYDNLLIGEGGGITLRIKYDSIRYVHQVLEALPSEIVIKKHPKHSKAQTEIDLLYDDLFSNREELPAYIPAELYLNNINKNVIAVSSTPLIVASQLDHLRAISLLDLLEWYNEDHKIEMKNNLIKMSNNKIKFVKDVDDLRQTLLS